MQHHATFSGEEITVHFSATGVKNDYGVRGSPVWYEMEDIEVDSMEMLGVEVDFKDLPEKVQAAIVELADELEFEA